ncbi:MAG: hypothetical protein QG673_855 [Pseudomonadota bacterium]|nr:hypothetical protein [Pseudomonadota bacterium]
MKNYGKVPPLENQAKMILNLLNYKGKGFSTCGGWVRPFNG